MVILYGIFACERSGAHFQVCFQLLKFWDCSAPSVQHNHVEPSWASSLHGPLPILLGQVVMGAVSLMLAGLDLNMAKAKFHP